MLPPRLVKCFGWRVKLMALAGGTYYHWDPVTGQLVPANIYQIYMMWTAFAGGIVFPLVHIIQIYLKTHPDDEIPDLGLTEEEEQYGGHTRSGLSPSLLIEYGEVLLVICIFFLNIISVHRMRLHMYLINQLIKYNTACQEMIDAGKLVLEAEQKMIVRVGEVILYVVFVATLFMPFGVLASLMHPVEPTHVLFREWLGIEFSLTLELSPFILIMMMAIYGCGTTIGLMMVSITLYFILSSVSLQALTPVEVDGPIRNKQCGLATRNLGSMEDDEVIQFYRTQHVLNILLNEFYKSYLISYHHVGVLATASCLICFAIGYHDILSEEGIVAYVVVFSCIWAPLSLIYIQSRMCGYVVDTSVAFKDQGKKLLGRGTFYYKFCRSCQTFYIQVAWPFYNIHKETFLLFCGQVLDWVLTLLLG